MSNNLSLSNRRKAMHGFTLIELMITVAVIAILAAVAYPSYTQYIIRGKRSAAQAQMMDIANREQQFLLANRVYADKATLTSNGYVLPSDVSGNYGWTITLNAVTDPVPSFLITFIPSGGQTSDGNITLDSVGNKLPTEKWRR